MVINVLDTKDLLELSLLKCKICHRRLHSPILQISGFANVCGSCTSDTNAERNVDLEALLQKLYLPCNYAGRGCEFEGNFDEVSIHEKWCGFQQLRCPLASYEQCDGDLDNIIEHMETKHGDNVLTVVDNHVSVKNPNAEVRSVFYLLGVDNLRFVVSAELDVKKGHIFYAFYCLNYDYSNLDDVKISILLMDEDTTWNSENIHSKQLSKGEAPSMFLKKNVIKLKCVVLESFGCIDTITIKIDTAKNAVPEKLIAKLKKPVTSSYKCIKCSAISKRIHYCNRTSAIVCCENCFKGSYQCHCCCSTDTSMIDGCFGTTAKIHSVINVDSFNPSPTFLCTNTGCNAEINADDYNNHIKLKCGFRLVCCSSLKINSCSWEGAFIDVVTHIRKEHADCVNRDVCRIKNCSGTSQQLCFIKENKSFLQTYQIKDNKLTVTTQTLAGHKYKENYKWLIYFKNPTNGCETLITNICTDDEEETTINVSGYEKNIELTLKVLFKRVGTNST